LASGVTINIAIIIPKGRTVFIADRLGGFIGKAVIP